MGVVYKAHDRVLGEDIALKVLRSEFGTTEEMADRFRSEIRLARKVRHRNVCGIHEYGEDRGLCYIAMEFVEGIDLDQLVRSRGPLPPAEAYDVAIQLLKGLQAVHDLGIIHRDLKAANVMRDTRGVVRLMDFGMARTRRMDRAKVPTAAGEVIGTPEYMSPEQARGERVDFQSDIYSAGIILFEVLTGDVPFRGDTILATLQKHVFEEPPLSGPRAARIPKAVLPVLRKALAKDADERYATVRGMIAAIRLVRETMAIPAAAEEAPPAASPSASPSPAPSSGADVLQALVLEIAAGEPEARRKAALTIAKLGTAAQAAVPALVEALRDPDAGVAEAAAYALKRVVATPEPAASATTPTRAVMLAASAGVEGLVGMLAHEDPAFRWRAAVALGELGAEAKGAVPALLDGLDDEDETVRRGAARALGKIGADVAAVPALAAALGDRTDELVRQYAAEALGRMGAEAKAAIPALIGALKDASHGVSDQAAEALLKIGLAAVPALVEAVKDEDERVRWKAADALTRISMGPLPGPGA
jgi:HEAT repeat protein